MHYVMQEMGFFNVKPGGTWSNDWKEEKLMIKRDSTGDEKFVEI